MVKFIVASHWLFFFLRHNQSQTLLLGSQTNQNSIKISKILSQLIRKRYYETLVTSVKNSLVSPPAVRKTLKFVYLVVILSGK